MNFTKAIYSKSVFFLALVPLFALWGFWFTYFARPGGTVSIFEHVHGYAMFAWILLLVLQSYLIRSNRRVIHRQTGKLAYVLGPLIVISTLALAHFRLNVRGLSPEGLYILGLQLFTLIQFTVCYAMALHYRKRPDVHARWMVCTAFSMLDPIFARVLLVNFIHVPLESGIAQYITYAFIDLIVIALVLRDWKSEHRRDVFMPVLGLVLVTQLPVFFVFKSTTWTAFANWYMTL